MTHNVNDKPAETLLEVLAWSYANLARADVALKEGAMTFSQYGCDSAGPMQSVES